MKKRAYILTVLCSISLLAACGQEAESRGRVTNGKEPEITEEAKPTEEAGSENETSGAKKPEGTPEVTPAADPEPELFHHSTGQASLLEPSDLQTA